ncbi:MAG: hypothetical protein KDA45_16920, partial [Planctomycetales bacterium]|nr:hypothetical protein [Planctomycetales bacterium]
THITLAWHLVLGTAFVAAGLLLDTRRARYALLAVLAVNVVALCCWGIVQRSLGTTNLLPGVANYVPGSNPFGSFIYKNSGGAAVVLGISALAGILTHRIVRLLALRPSAGGRAGGRSGYSQQTYRPRGGLAVGVTALATQDDDPLPIVSASGQ